MKTITIDGITYEATPLAESSASHILVKIGKRGKVTKQHRPGVLRQDGTWNLLAWARS